MYITDILKEAVRIVLKIAGIIMLLPILLVVAIPVGFMRILEWALEE